jgi:hypothetical protein
MLKRILFAFVPVLFLVGGFSELSFADEFDFGDGGDFLSEMEIAEDEIVELPPEPSILVSHAAPIGLGLFFVFLIWLNRKTVPFAVSKESLQLRNYPTGVKRGLAMATVLYGIAFFFGALEIVYQLNMQGTAEAYFANMSLGKLIAFTHAHLFGFTTSFIIIGVPFSMQFNHVKVYQMVFPIGLIAALVDVMSWWGIKYVHPNFEHISMVCGILFSLSYMIMLIGLVRVLIFPEVIWRTDRDRFQRMAQKRAGARDVKSEEEK